MCRLRRTAHYIRLYPINIRCYQDNVLWYGVVVWYNMVRLIALITPFPLVTKANALTDVERLVAARSQQSCARDRFTVTSFPRLRVPACAPLRMRLSNRRPQLLTLPFLPVGFGSCACLTVIKIRRIKLKVNYDFTCGFHKVFTF